MEWRNVKHAYFRKYLTRDNESIRLKIRLKINWSKKLLIKMVTPDVSSSLIPNPFTANVTARLINTD